MGGRRWAGVASTGEGEERGRGQVVRQHAGAVGVAGREPKEGETPGRGWQHQQQQGNRQWNAGAYPLGRHQQRQSQQNHQSKDGSKNGGQDPWGRVVEEKWALDLFSGTGSVKEVLQKHGWKVVTVDWDPKWRPDIVADVGRWKYWEVFNPGDFDLIAASPPCTEYSAAKTTKPRKLLEADKIVKEDKRID